MDGITAAVALMGEKMAIQRLNAAVGMVKQNAESQQAIVEMVSASAGSGTVYSGEGAIPQVDLGQVLNAQA